MKINSSGKQVKFGEKIPKVIPDKAKKMGIRNGYKGVEFINQMTDLACTSAGPQCPSPLSASGCVLQTDILDKEFQEGSRTAVALTEMKLCREEGNSRLWLTLNLVLIIARHFHWNHLIL